MKSAHRKQKALNETLSKKLEALKRQHLLLVKIHIKPEVFRGPITEPQFNETPFPAGDSSKPRNVPRRALKKLLDRIRSQRTQFDHSHRVPAADQIPERDTTIDSGSLCSEDKLPPPPPPGESHAASRHD